jgi:hypothetical protein
MKVGRLKSTLGNQHTSILFGFGIGAHKHFTIGVNP